jgi:hypothetical protein
MLYDVKREDITDNDKLGKMGIEVVVACLKNFSNIRQKELQRTNEKHRSGSVVFEARILLTTEPRLLISFLEMSKQPIDIHIHTHINLCVYIKYIRTYFLFLIQTQAIPGWLSSGL